MAREAQAPVNLFELRPRRRARFARGIDGLVTVLVPKFTGRLAVRWLVPLMARPDVSVRLDREGSFVWDRCDGATTVEAIAAALHADLGAAGDEAAVAERVGRFVEKLAHASLVTLDLPGDGR